MKVAAVALITAIVFAGLAAHGAPPEPGYSGPVVAYRLKIAPQALGAALQELARQSDTQIIFFSKLTEGLTAAGLDGNFTIPQAMERLLADSGLTFRQLSEGTLEIQPRPPAAGDTPRSAAGGGAASSSMEDSKTGIPEILVTAARDSLNLDVRRTEDDVLPYVVFDGEQVKRSGASTIEEFLKYRLPMNAVQGTYSQNVGIVFGARSQVDLRGFGTNQTLILIDGRRTSNAVVNGSLQQLDLNGIPLGAIERIEVLPASASGIYGGDATGGVINIILRRDYEGAELAIGYDNVFDGDDRRREVALTAGFNLEGGKTHVSMAGFWSDANLLMRQEREFIRRYRDRAFANRPALWLPPALPPLGYTTNIRSTGPNLTLDDGTPLHSTFTSVPIGYAGAAQDGGAALVANAGTYNFDLADSSQNPGASSGGRVSLLNNPSLKSINFLVRREFGSRVQAFIEAFASKSVGHSLSNGLASRFTLPADAANNPFQQEIEVLVPVPSPDVTTASESRNRRLVAGVITTLPWTWRGELDYVWHSSGSRHFAPGYVRSGAAIALDTAVRTDPNFNPLRDSNVYPLDLSPYTADLMYEPFRTTTRSVALLLGGPVGSLPGGAPVLSVRLEHRDENFGGGTFRRGSTAVTFYPPKSQTVRSVVGELRIPVISENNTHALARELELQLSGRRDDYMTRGSVGQVSSTSATPSTRTTADFHSINPAVGLRWKPLDDLMMRASYGKGFLPPNVTQLAPDAPAPGIGPSTLIDPRRGNLPIGTIITLQTGGNSELSPEESESWSVGTIYTPRWFRDLRLSFDYTKIDRVDGIAGHPFGAQGLIDDEAQFPGRIVRGTPTDAEAALGWAGPITFVDVTLLNISMASMEACDIQLDYRLDTVDAGTFELYALGTWNRHNITQTKKGEPRVDNVGYRGGVLGHRINAGATWHRRNYTLGWNTRYLDSYLAYGALGTPLTQTDIANRDRLVQIQGSSKVAAQVYHDAFATYRFGHGSTGPASDLLNGIELSLGIRNIFDHEPPRDQLSYSTYGDPRLRSYSISFKKSFGGATRESEP